MAAQGRAAPPDGLGEAVAARGRAGHTRRPRALLLMPVGNAVEARQLAADPPVQFVHNSTLGSLEKSVMLHSPVQVPDEASYVWKPSAHLAAVQSEIDPPEHSVHAATLTVLLKSIVLHVTATSLPSAR